MKKGKRVYLSYGKKRKDHWKMQILDSIVMSTQNMANQAMKTERASWIQDLSVTQAHVQKAHTWFNALLMH